MACEQDAGWVRPTCGAVADHRALQLGLEERQVARALGERSRHLAVAVAEHAEVRLPVADLYDEDGLGRAQLRHELYDAIERGRSDRELTRIQSEVVQLSQTVANPLERHGGGEQANFAVDGVDGLKVDDRFVGREGQDGLELEGQDLGGAFGGARRQ